MNITGSLTITVAADEPNPSGAFTAVNLDHHMYGVGERTHSKNTLNFNASKAWTGETSAVGGGASHTHGIKMTVRGNADTADKTSADNGAATATMKKYIIVNVNYYHKKLNYTFKMHI